MRGLQVQKWQIKKSRRYTHRDFLKIGEIGLSPKGQCNFFQFFRISNFRRSHYLFREFRKFLVEFVDTTGGVDKFHFTREKGVAESGNFHLHKRIFFAVFPNGGFFRVDAGTTQKGLVGRDVFEHHKTVVAGMNVFFHV
jgi:hypothetical protein